MAFISPAVYHYTVSDIPKRGSRRPATESAPWGEVEAEPEVSEWLLGLPNDDFGHVQFYIDLLGSRGALLSEPYTRQLDGKLRELRFYVGTMAHRISYYIATGRRIILLTIFSKDQRHEGAEIERARRAMARCVAEGHTAED